MKKSIQAMIYAHLEKAPERRALAFYNKHREYSWLTLEETHNQALNQAARLAAGGVGRGDACILVLPSDQYATMMLIAVLYLGAVPLLIAPPVLQGRNSSLKEILSGIIGKTRPKAVVCQESLSKMRQELEQLHGKTHFLFGEKNQSAGGHSVTIPTATPDETDIAAMQLTSGTTGFPRICVWKQKNVMAALGGMAAAMKLGEEDIFLNWTPLYHDMGLVNNFLLCFTRGLPLVMLSPYDFVNAPQIWLQGLSDTGATTTWSPNFGFTIAAQRVRDAHMQDVRLDGVRAYWNAAERIHFNSMRAFHERFAPYGVSFEALKTNFGCAENIGGATFSDPDGPLQVERIDRETFQNKRIALLAADSADEDQTLTIVCVGSPHPEINIRILTEDGEPLPDGHVGEIGLDTPSRMEEYLYDPEETRRAMVGNLVRTGDLGYMRDGKLFWVGRARERITVRGKKLDPSDFEPVLLNVPGVRKGCFAAFGVDDSQRGTQRIVIVTEVPDRPSGNREEICNDIRRQTLQRLGMMVDDIVIVKQGTLTKTSSGKRRHRHFRQLYLDGRLKSFEQWPD